MKKVLLFNRIGDGLVYKFVTMAKPKELEAMEMKTIGDAMFHVANVIQDSDDLNDLWIEIPYFPDMIFVYSEKRDAFIAQ